MCKDMNKIMTELGVTVECFILGNFPASEFYMSTFRNTLSVASS
jgi:hypothetical protein